MDESSWLPALTVTNVLIAAVVGLLVYYLKPYFFPVFPNLKGPPSLPLLGSNWSFFGKGAGYDREWVDKYGKIFRVYEGRNEALFCADVDMLKFILVKNFTEFRNRRYIPLRGFFKHGLFDATDNTWVRLRHLLTPSFTSGKLKQMIPMIHVCENRLMENIEKEVEEKGEFEAKKACGAFTMDVIATTAFGIDLNATPDNNVFLKYAIRLFTFKFTSPRFFFNIIVLVVLPFLAAILDKLNYEAFEPEAMDFFQRLLKNTIKDRKAQKGSRMDFLQLMLNVENQELDQEGKADLEGVETLDEGEKSKGLSSTEILAQAMLFFLAAYETTSTTMSFLIHNLATNQEAQEKLHQEIQEVMKDYKEANYEAISKMTYLEQCIQETLRMYPAVLRVDRRSAVDVTYKGIHIPKGTVINVPIYAIHYDEEVYPNPKKFDPERFSAEARNERSQFHHLPFGLGPRQCIGMRLALMEIKLAFIKLMTKYRFMPGTMKPFQPDMRMMPTTKQGIWIKLEAR